MIHVLYMNLILLFIIAIFPFPPFPHVAQPPTAQMAAMTVNEVM